MRAGDPASFDESKNQVVRPFNLVAMYFDSATLFVNSTPYDITFDGDIYLGVGTLGGFNAIPESTDGQAKSVDFTLSGIPTEYISIAFNEEYQGRPVNAWIGFLDTDHTMSLTPILAGSWKMDTMDIDMGKTAKISLKAESKMIDFRRAKAHLYTNEDQQRAFPDDKGLQFVNEMAQKREIVWGRKN